ncbi:ADP-forming succinate--CoA ligase subunit beta [Parabacteroides sp. Marseille-P3160]|uniref:ADP-forming succinate--CoA ligase subunit beta n=1 Tax=Parabacteroides sp. Marseille-P3160 TaxID=1917887 RepID=UPI0009BBED4C|nr:ADP-forming succinate--CoA ligase subunit beta [Parabacteroides sp. Marseille-P3160]
MKIHEYQSKELFSSYGIPVGRQILCYTPSEAVSAYGKLGVLKVVLKAQVLTGGRGKAGGVKLAGNAEEVKRRAEDILSLTIKGFPVKKLIVTEAADIAAEYYVSYIIDRNSKSVILMMSREGGIDIETVARETPEKIHSFPIDPFIGLPDYLARRYAFLFFDSMEQVNALAGILQKLYRLFMEKDANLAEINPLVATSSGELLAVDAKMTFDDNARYRRPEIEALLELTKEEKTEIRAKEKGFSYVHMDGNIGCMVNGAGLAMSTMDMIKLYGGEPANFLDIGGSSKPEKVVDAMKLLLDKTQVQVVLINIFGGITRCDDVAIGLLEAFKKIETNIPIVVRLTGTNEEEGRRLLENTRFLVAESMSEATRMAVQTVKTNEKHSAS